jgi:hypothetical protein
MPIEGLYYKQSGRFKPYAPVVLFLGCGLCSALAGVLYGIVNLYSPSVYINVFLPVVLGLGIGALIWWVAKWTHTRSLKMVVAAGLFSGVLLEYTAFVSWVFALSKWQVLVLMPQDIFRVLGLLAVDGVWEISGAVFTGWELYTVWVLEACAIVAVAAFFPYVKVKPMAYCERCGAWVTGRKSVLPFEPIANPAEFRAHLERGDFAVLGSLAAVSYDAPNCTSYDLSHCTWCNDLYLLSIETIKKTVNNKGSVEEVKTEVIRNMIIDAESHELIQQLEPADHIKEGLAEGADADGEAATAGVEVAGEDERQVEAT